MKSFQVTVVYALPDVQYIYKVSLKSGSTVKDAILSSNILNLIKNVSLYNNRIGIYNKLVHLNLKIKDRDRIEIYRKLIVDPKDRRRKNILLS